MQLHSALFLHRMLSVPAPMNSPVPCYQQGLPLASQQATAAAVLFILCSSPTAPQSPGGRCHPHRTCATSPGLCRGRAAGRVEQRGGGAESGRRAAEWGPGIRAAAEAGCWAWVRAPGYAHAARYSAGGAGVDQASGCQAPAVLHCSMRIPFQTWHTMQAMARAYLHVHRQRLQQPARCR